MRSATPHRDMTNPTNPNSTDKPEPQPALAASACSACGQPGKYIRARDFETQIAHVWMCENKTCKNHNLYWHTDSPKPSLTFASERARQSAFRIIWKLQQNCTSDAQYRIYAEREREIRLAPIVTPNSNSANSG